MKTVAPAATVTGSFPVVYDDTGNRSLLTGTSVALYTDDGQTLQAETVTLTGPTGFVYGFSVAAPAADGYYSVKLVGTDATGRIVERMADTFQVTATGLVGADTSWDSFVANKGQVGLVTNGGIATTLLPDIIREGKPSWLDSGNVSLSFMPAQNRWRITDGDTYWYWVGPTPVGTYIAIGHDNVVVSALVPAQATDAAAAIAASLALASPDGLPSKGDVAAIPAGVVGLLITAGLAQYVSGSSGPLQWTAVALALAPISGAGGGLTKQDVADAGKLAPGAGTPATGSQLALLAGTAKPSDVRITIQTTVVEGGN